MSRARLHSERIARIARLGDIPSLDAAVAAALADGCVLNAVNRTTLANARATAGDLDGAAKVLHQMRHDGVRPTNATLRVAIKAARSNAEIIEALLWFESDGSEPAEIKSWNMALRKLAHSHGEANGSQTQLLSSPFYELQGDDKDGRSMSYVLRVMLERGSNNGNVPIPDTYSFNSVIDGWRRRQNLQNAFGVFGHMRVRAGAARPDVVTFNTLLALCIDNQNNENAEYQLATTVLSNFIAAMPRCMRCHKVEPDLITHTLLLQAIACSQKGTDFISGTIQRRDRWFTPQNGSDRFRSHSYVTSFRTMARRRASSQIIRLLWDGVPGRPDRRYFNSLIAAFARVGDLKGAITALTRMSKHHNFDPDLYTFNSMISAASRGGDADLACKLLFKLKRHKKYLPDAFSYTGAIRACRNDPKRAVALLEDAEQSGIRATAPMLNAALLSHGSDIDGALRCWRIWRSSGNFASVVGNVQVYRALLRVAGVSGKPDMALRILHAGRRTNELESSKTPGLFTAFSRGLREGGMTQKMETNLICKQYLQHLQLECRTFKRMSCLPVEFIRIRY